MKTTLLKQIREKYLIRYDGGAYTAVGRKKIHVFTRRDALNFLVDILTFSCGFCRAVSLLNKRERKMIRRAKRKK